MLRWLANFWEDFLVTVDELHKAGFIFPPHVYPFEIFINPKWLKPEDDASEQK